MSRSISIGYMESPGGPETSIEVSAPYFLLGTQQTSLQFWSLPVWERIGVKQLAILGETDPVYFWGWEMMDELADELRLYQEHLAEIEFQPEVKAAWLAHLIYCYSLLVSQAPHDSIPVLGIG
ncbi:hypothetical protein [Gimesia chilikensis]|uniref:hypothetical protein n=1 Tax=Gimesia chilikensis TaxID=2605989 RepID=UPI003A942EEF